METLSFMRNKKLVYGISLFASVFGSFQVSAEDNKWAGFNGIDLPDTLPGSVLEQKKVTDDLFYKVSDHYIDLSEVMLEIKTRSSKPMITVIVADTIEVSQNFILNMENQSLYIFARRIVGDASGTVIFNVDEERTGNVGVFSEEMSARINVAGLFPNFIVDVKTINASSAETGELIFPSRNADELAVAPISLAGLMDVAPDLLGSHLEKTFDLAAVVHDQSQALSHSMLNWNEAALRALPETRANDVFMENLYLQIANLKQFFDFSTLSNNYVPELSASLYQDTYIAYLDAMEAYRTQYDRFVDRNLDISARIDSANLMHAHLSDAVAAESATIERSERQIDALNETMDSLRLQFRDQEFIADSARLEFQIGLNVYKQQQQIALAVSVLETVASAGTAIASRDPAEMANLVASIPATAQELQSLQEKINGIADVLERVQEMASSVDELSSLVSDDVNQQSIADAFDNFTLTVPSLEEANNVWDIFLLEVQHELQLAVDEGIGGAREFLIALETLVIYGKSMTATEVSLIQEMSRLIDLKITAEVNRRHSERMLSLIDGLESQGDSTTELELIFHRSLNALKRPMFVAVAKFAAAFNYWGLTTSAITPSLNKTYEEYRLDLAFIQEEYNEILTRFDPRPQSYNITNVLITEPALLDDFKQDGEMSFPVSLSHPDFIHFDRVRLSRVRVILQGAGLEEGQSYFIDIESNGEYQDRLDGKEFTFNADPLFRFFGYELLDSANNDYSVIIDGAVADEFKFAFFEPTPFTTWSISLRNIDSVDLSQVESIKLEFMGNAIPRLN